MSEIRDNIPGPWKRKAPESDASSESSSIKKPRLNGDSTSSDEAPDENMPRAMPRSSYLLIAPEEGHNIPRTLIEQEANQVNPILLLADIFEAYVFLDCPRFVDRSTMFWVFDVHNTHYNMRFLKLHETSGPTPAFFIHGWTDFVKDHKLGADDQILFNKNLDTTIFDDFYYILKYVKKPDSSKKLGDDAESSKKLGDGAESCIKQGAGAESSTKLSDVGAESSRKPGDGAESRKKTGDSIESSTKLSDDGAESSREPGDCDESSTKLSDDSDQSVLGIEMPVFKVIYHRVLLKTLPDQEQINAPRPGSRPFQLRAICLSKTLTVSELSSWLYFDVYDAIVLTDDPRVAETLPSFSMDVVMSDRDNRRYKMTLRHLEMQGGIFGFSLDGWDRFVKNHSLERGDRVAIYKFLDRRIHSSYYFVVLKLPADVNCQNRRNPFRPGSRELMPGSHCFSKILSEDDVSSRAAGLQLGALQARHFESSSRSLNELFMVFDGDDYQYAMKLSYYFNSVRVLMCFLENTANWHLFVLRNNLRAGDTIHVNKTFDQRVCADHYFVITFTRAVELQA